MLFTQDIDKLLNEITIKDKWQKESNKWQGKLDAETFEYLCELDPTTNPKKVGRYTNWILAKYNPNADFDRLKICLEWYADGIKRGIINRLGISNDINAYKSYDEFITAMNGVMHSDDSSMSNSEYNNRQKLEGQFEILGSNSTFDIVVCKTFAAERYFGSGTEWCTVANESYFNSYMKKGPLYIIYPKNGNEELKMQFHFESDSYADKNDEVYEEPAVCIEETIEDENIQTALFQLCKKVFSKHKTKFVSFREKLQVVQQRLSNGEDPEDVFDNIEDFYEGFAGVELNYKWNFINTEGNILCNQWFDEVYDFNEGFAIVEILNKGYNYINTNGELLSDQWYDEVGNFFEGFAVVYKKKLGYNFINVNMQLISKQWFDNVRGFREGFAAVKLNDEWNLINTEGQILCDQWYDYVDDFREGFAAVKLNGKYSFINQEGQILSNQWYDDFAYINVGFAKVKLQGKWNYINNHCQLISDQWFDDVKHFEDNCGRVEIKGKGYNFINTEGEILSKQWFDDAWDFEDGFAPFVINHKYNFINTEGEILSKQWFDYLTYFNDGFSTVTIGDKKYKLDTNGQLYDLDGNKINNNIRENKMRQRVRLTESSLRKMIKESIRQVLRENEETRFNQFDYIGEFSESGITYAKLNGMYNLIDNNGNILLRRWVKRPYELFKDDFAVVEMNGKYNFVDKNFELLSDQWFDWCSDFRNGVAKIEIDGQSYRIDTNGNILG